MVLESKAEYIKKAPFTFEYSEKLLRTKNFGILSTVTDTAHLHLVGVVYTTSALRLNPFRYAF